MFQVYENLEHTVCYFSRKLDKHQISNYTLENEALVLIFAVRMFAVYVASNPVTVYSDHSTLQFLNRMTSCIQNCFVGVRSICCGI